MPRKIRTAQQINKMSRSALWNVYKGLPVPVNERLTYNQATKDRLGMYMLNQFF